MPLQKQSVNINFSGGLDTKSDDKQVHPGKFLSLQNTIFTKAGLLQKRNGFSSLTELPSEASTLTTFNGNLISAGTNVEALLKGDTAWFNQGRIQPIDLSVLPLVRSSVAQISLDAAVATGSTLVVTGWSDSAGNSFYQVQDSDTGQVAVGPVALPATATRVRTFVLGRYFIVTFTQTVTGSPHLRYISIPITNPANPAGVIDVSAQISSITAAYDGYVANNNLYLSWNGSDGGGAIRSTFLTSTLSFGPTVIEAGQSAVLLSVTADLSANTAVIWVSYSNNTNYRAIAYNPALVTILGPTTIGSSTDGYSLTSVANNGVLTIVYETALNYSYVSKRSDFVSTRTLTQAGTAGSAVVMLRGVGLGSKSFIVNGVAYVTVAYGSSNSGMLQPTYFVSDLSGNVVAKLAYTNGGGYYANPVLPGVTVNGFVASFGYLFKDLIASVNPQSLTPPSTTSNIYSQTGANLAFVDFTLNPFPVSEIGHNLLLGGGFLWMYDGVKPVEQNFHLFPEDVLPVTDATTGAMTAQEYFYQAIYEWTDAQGNLHRSAPSVPVSVTLTSDTSVLVNVPTARLTYKTAPNPIRITIYRWSTAQQDYYQVTSIQNPVINNPAADSIAYIDSASDASILGNNLIYTTGNVIENTGAPAAVAMSLYKSRLFMIDAEDRNLLWYSKQVIENTPVEMSDLLTLFVAPTTGAQGSTGECAALAPLDDKLIIFKEDAIYYLVGTGPDATGSNNDFSEPIYITGTVGCANPESIVLTPQGLMFQSDKGIWLLGRDLSTQYIGAPVEAFNSYQVTSANAIPATNQVRFTLNSKILLMYDYFYGQWGTFNTPEARSATLYQGKHTFLTPSSFIYQESIGKYLDGSDPVLISFATSWLNLAGLSGYERAYFFYLLGSYVSPHKLIVGVAYDYNPAPSHQVVISPTNYNPPYGGDSPYGQTSPYGGPPVLEQWKVHLQRQTCQAFQITLTEAFDPFFQTVAGEGLTLSGINCTVGMKKGYRPLGASRSVG